MGDNPKWNRPRKGYYRRKQANKQYRYGDREERKVEASDWRAGDSWNTYDYQASREIAKEGQETRRGWGRRGRGDRGNRRKFNYGRMRDVPREKIRIKEAALIAREKLPVYKHKEEIVKSIESMPVSLIQGETGSGKSTQVPIFILERWPDARIVVSQPRRLATIAVSRKIASDLSTPVGDLVGYHIKGEKNYGPQSQLVFMTSGMLIQELSGLEKNDREVLPWNFVIIDEVHERTLEIDFLLVIFKHYLIKRDFKLVLMSATLESVMSNYFSSSELDDLRGDIDEDETEEVFEKEPDPDDIWDSVKPPTPVKKNNRYEEPTEGALPVLRASDRLFKVSILYLENVLGKIYEEQLKQAEFYDDILQDVFARDASLNPEEVHPALMEIATFIILLTHTGSLVEEERPGSFLVFLPGIAEINEMNDFITKIMSQYLETLEICLLHSSVPEELHQKILVPPREGIRRIVLSTNIAESSITLVDICYVIDFGYSREKNFNSETNSESLELVWAAKSMMIQRAGRAGRVSNGICYRMMTEAFFENSLFVYAKPEIQRCPIDKLVLKLKQLHFKNPRSILKRAISSPAEDEILKTEVYLQEMGALNAQKEITSLGNLYADMPCDLKVTRLCLFGLLFQCIREALLVGAILITETPPILSFYKVPYLANKRQLNAFSTRLQIDAEERSDLIGYLNAYLHWFSLFGVRTEREMIKRGHRGLKKVPISDQEYRFCDANYYDPSAMREIVGNFNDLKNRFEQIGVRHFPERYSWNDRNSEILQFLRLCIASSYTDKYLVCEYEIEDDFNRHNLLRKMGEDPEHSIFIPSLQPRIQTTDLLELLSHAGASPISAELHSNNLVVRYPSNVPERVLKMAIWIGNYTNRYYYLDWIVCKRVVTGPKASCTNEKDRNFLRKKMSQIPREKRREGNQIILDERYFDEETSKFLELTFLGRPQNPFRLKTYDLISKFEIKISEESVNSVLFSPDRDVVGVIMIVATEYVAKRNLTLAKNTTLMPMIPLMPQLLTLIFCKDADFIAENGRYDSFKPHNVHHRSSFDYQFTGKDIEEINEIRTIISKFLENVDSFLGKQTDYNIFEKIFQMLNRYRPKVERDLPDWRKIVGFPEEDRAVKAKYATDEASKNQYLPPLIPLDMFESSIHWAEDRTEKMQQEAELARTMKENYLQSLKKRAELAYFTETTVLCAICDCEICIASTVKQTDFDPEVCRCIGIYGSTKVIDKAWVFEEQKEFQDYMEQKYNPNTWVACQNGHLIGWDERGRILLPLGSPLKIAFPTMKMEEWDRKFWDNNNQILKEMSEAYDKKYKEELQIAKHCPICDFEFKENKDFAYHVSLDKSHKERAEDFLKYYIP